MRIRMSAGGLLAAALLAVGCGGVDTTLDEPSHLATRKDMLPPCDGERYYRHVVYSDESYTTEIGGWTCLCGEYNGWIYGSINSPYYQEFDLGVCMPYHYNH
jgi:hypothetical protein